MSNALPEVVIVSGARTPMAERIGCERGDGQNGGALAAIAALALGAAAARGALDRAALSASRIDHVVFGNALQTSGDALYGARHVALKAGLPDQASGVYQTVLANILATPLKLLAPLLCARVASGGSLVLAGILERQSEELKAAYSPYAKLEVSDAEDGWILMTATR